MPVNWTNIASRLKALRNKEGLSQAEFSAIAGMSRSAYGQVETGAINMGLDAIATVCDHFKIPITDIILDNDQKMVSLPKTGITPITVTVDAIGRERIVMVDLKARASYPLCRLEASYFKPLTSFSLPGDEFQQSTFRCFEVDGDSMEKTMFAGDFIIAKAVDLSVQKFKDGYVYVIVTDEDVIVKRIEYDSETSLVLTSDNNFYKPIHIELSAIREAWFAVKKISGNFTRIDTELNTLVHALSSEFILMRERLNILESKRQ